MKKILIAHPYDWERRMGNLMIGDRWDGFIKTIEKKKKINNLSRWTEWMDGRSDGSERNLYEWIEKMDEWFFFFFLREKDGREGGREKTAKGDKRPGEK